MTTISSIMGNPQTQCLPWKAKGGDDFPPLHCMYSSDDSNTAFDCYVTLLWCSPTLIWNIDLSEYLFLFLPDPIYLAFRLYSSNVEFFLVSVKWLSNITDLSPFFQISMMTNPILSCGNSNVNFPAWKVGQIPSTWVVRGCEFDR